MDKTDSNIGWHLTRAAFAWRNAVDQYMAELGLTQSRWVAMLHLSRTGEGCSQKDLASDLGIEQPSLQRTLNLLEEADLIERRACPHDARRKTLWFTTKGKALLEEMEIKAKAGREQMLIGFAEQEREVFYELLTRVIDNADSFFNKDSK